MLWVTAPAVGGLGYCCGILVVQEMAVEEVITAASGAHGSGGSPGGRSGRAQMRGGWLAFCASDGRQPRARAWAPQWAEAVG